MQFSTAHGDVSSVLATLVKTDAAQPYLRRPRVVARPGRLASEQVFDEGQLVGGSHGIPTKRAKGASPVCGRLERSDVGLEWDVLFDQSIDGKEAAAVT
ncbi:unnamed protein product [Parascedosporium putredinis]|uniref:Uncharacterized protein n=1 Tax=Parascedosporium putredinis TaxID=1442378 RepID=A0A9P1MDV3_9PEZI|nr:unnamed protein product [Parascedosporium putredinis]CAI8004389.1 unnamed protein product [Parascedosporium putredinis]